MIIADKASEIVLLRKNYYAEGFFLRGGGRCGAGERLTCHV